MLDLVNVLLCENTLFVEGNTRCIENIYSVYENKNVFPETLFLIEIPDLKNEYHKSCFEDIPVHEIL